MTNDRDHPRWTAYVLDELDEQERAEFEKEMESTSGTEAILAETRDAVALLREGFACEKPVYLSAEQKRAIEVEAALRVPWFRNRLYWATGVAAAVLAGVVTITVPKLLRLQQPADAKPVVSSVDAPSTVTLPATGSPVSSVDSESRIESEDGIRESQARASGLAPSEPKAAPDVEVVRTTETEPADVLLPSAPSESAERSPREPRQLMAKIHGLVTDLTGAMVPDVDVIVTREASGQVLRDVTDDDGKYSLPILRPGSYLVQGVMLGFKADIQIGVQMQGERNTRIDLLLEPGEISEQLLVSGRSSPALPPPPPPPPGAQSRGVIGALPQGVPGRFPGGPAASHMGAVGGVHPDRTSPDVAVRTQFNTEEYGRILDNPFVAVRTDPLATFSIDVDTAAYANVRRFLNQFTRPPRDAVRIEEMVNYFNYDYAGPTDEHPVRIHAEAAPAPWSPEHRLVRLGVQGRRVPSDKRTPSNLVFLIDVSGSMQDANKLPLLKDGMELLVEQLDENDRVAIVVYAGAAGLVLPSTPGDRKQQLFQALDRLAAGGPTNGGAGIGLAYDTAAAHFIKGGTNRVILATDGDFNVGVTDEGALTRLIEEKAVTGVFLSVLGFGTGNYNDTGLEALAHHGNGNYAYIDTIREARKVLVEEMRGTLVTIAKDVKIQVEFNPAEVNAYRLIGYENRVLEYQDFNDDTKDAGEMGSGHTVTVLFEVVPSGVDISLPGVDPLKYQTPANLRDGASRGEMLTVKVRYKDPDGEASRRMEVAVADRDAGLAEASTDYHFAAAVAGFGMILRDSPHKGQATLDSILRLAEASLGRDEKGYRKEFVDLARKVYAISLHELAAKGSVEAIEALLAAGADPNVPDNEGRTPLHWASTNENPAVIEMLLAAGADSKVRDSSNATPLRWAIRHENVAAIEALLAAGADPNVPDNEGRTPLHWASTNENPAVIEMLLAAGADSKVRDSSNATPLRWAIRHENVAAIEALLAAGADPNMPDEHALTPLQWAAKESENPAVFEMLLAAGADPNARGSYHETPLHTAAWHGNPALVQALLAAGVDVEARNEGGHTPLLVATDHNKNPLVIEMLLAAGANPNARDDDGETPLHWAGREGNPVVVDVLLAAGAEVNAQTEANCTPLHWATGNKNPAVIRTLVAAGANPDVRDTNGDTPLHWASTFQNPAVVQAILAAPGADVAARNKDGHTPLHWAAGSNENPAVIRTLVTAGANPNVVDTNGDTPLHWAAGSNENPAVIRTLMTAGADVQARNGDGHTPLQMANKHNGNAAVREMLFAAENRQ